MAELEFDLVESGEFEAFPPITSVDYSDEMKQYLASIHSIRTGVSVGVALQEINSLGDGLFSGQSRVEATALVSDKFAQTTRSAIETTSLPDIMVAEETRVKEQEVVENSQAPEILAETQGNPGDVWDFVSSRTAARTSVLHKKLAEVAGNTELTILSGLLDFADIVASFPFDVLTGGGFNRADLAREIRTLLSADVSEEQFNTRLDEVLEEARDAGWFSDENALFLFGEIASLQQGGVGAAARIDKIGTVLDAAFLPATALSVGRFAVRGVNAARNTTSIIGAIRGPRASKEVLESALNNPGTVEAAAAGIPEHTLPGFLRMPNSGVDPQAWSAPGFDAALKNERTNLFFNIIRNFNFSRRIDPAVFDTWLPKGLKALNDELDATARSNVLSMRIDPDDSGNIFGSILFGRRDGAPFSTKGNATKFANKHGGDVTPVTQGDKTFYIVEQTKNLSTAGLVNPLDAWEIGNHFFGEWGATFLTVPQRLEALAKRGEGVLGRLTVEIAPLVRSALKATNKVDTKRVEEIFWTLRDGSLSQNRRALTMPEFRNEWTKGLDKAPPSKAAENLYLTIQELNDALYFIKADRIFKEVVDEGHQVSVFRHVNRDGDLTERNILIRPAPEDLPVTTIVYDPATGVRLPISELKANQKVFVVDGGVDVGGEVARFIIADAKGTRRVFHSDVLGYNPGGPRGYDFINFAVKQASEVAFIDGTKAAGRARTFLGTATRKEAELAVEQVNNIFAKIRELAPGLRNMTKANALDALRAIGNDPDLLEVVLRNNDWNITGLEDVMDFIRFVEDYRLDPRLNVGLAHMDDALAIADDVGDLVFNVRKGETHRSDFDGIMNQPRNGPRQNDPLIGFGGDRAQTVSPLDMISRDFIRSTHERAFSAYNFQAVGGWLKGATRHITNDIGGLRPREAMNAAQFAKNPSPEARAYINARNAINRTLGHVSEYETRWNGFIERLSESVYDKGWKKTGVSVAQAQLSKRPLESIRAFAFHSKLGLFAFDQLFVQSSQVFNIIAIAGPVRSFPAMVTATPLRMTLLNTSEAFAREIGRRAAAFTGMDAEEFVRFSRWVRESGRTVIGGEVSELNAVSDVMAKGMVGRVAEVGRFFFDEGERFPRMVGMHVAWKEYAKKFPKLDPFSNHGINWITSRQDILTASMTRSSAAMWQKGPLSVPFQFLSYSSRMMESIFSNRLLTKVERAKLATAQLAFWGAAGTGVGGPVLDYYITAGGLEMDPNEYTALRYGVLDWAVGISTGADTGFGSRLAVGEGFWNLWEDFSEKTLFEAVGGPAVQTITDFTDIIFQNMVDVANGNTTMVASDVQKLLRNFTGPNKAYNAWVVYTTGDYLARNETVVAKGLNKTDALVYLMGAPLQEISLAYSRLQVMENQDGHIKEHGKRLGEMARNMRQKVLNGDMEGAANLSKQMAVAIAAQEPWIQEKLKFFWVPDATPFMEDMINKAIERGQANIDIHRDEGE